MFRWSSRLQGAPAPREVAAAGMLGLRVLGRVVTELRQKVRTLTRDVDDTSAREVMAAAHHVNTIVERAREYVSVNQEALASVTGEHRDSVTQLISAQSELLRSFAKEMAARATTQDEHARRASQHAATIGDLASGIEQLAGDARMLAINARIESARSGGGRGGFDVLAAEMRRLSDAVAASNDRVRELAAMLGHDLTVITDHARELRADTHGFATEAAGRIEETERRVKDLRDRLVDASRAGEAGMQVVLQSSQSALSHLQFQDVMAQQLRQLDGWLRGMHVELATHAGADAAELEQVPPAEFVSQSGIGTGEPAIAAAGDVTLF